MPANGAVTDRELFEILGRLYVSGQMAARERDQALAQVGQLNALVQQLRRAQGESREVVPNG